MKWYWCRRVDVQTQVGADELVIRCGSSAPELLVVIHEHLDFCRLDVAHGSRAERSRNEVIKAGFLHFTLRVLLLPFAHSLHHVCVRALEANYPRVDFTVGVQQLIW